tara:strand:- start:595 stop:894 length:300 start_codon:yes stop_codon:yes gene_type:complete
MRYSASCICGYETPLVDDKDDIDYDLLHAHQEFCEAAKEYMINALVDDDIASIRRSLAMGDESFLDAVLRGDGWIPYNQLTDEQLQKEYEERDLDGDEQ